MSKALHNIRVLELAEGWSAAALCGRLLAELGAEVIKIEPPAGDFLRKRKPLAPYGGSYDFQLIAANKKSVCINPAIPQDGELLKRLIGKTDVIIEDSLFAREQGLSTDFEVSRNGNRALIHCGISPFGSSGPLSNYTGNELVMQAMSGMMATTGFAGDLPTRVGILCGEHVAGIFAGISVLGALCHRYDSGTGQEIDISVHDCLVSYLGTFMPAFFTTGKNPERIGNLHPMVVPWNSYRAKDGWVIICTGNDLQWGALVKAMGRDDLTGDDRYVLQDKRIARRGEIDGIISQWTATKNVDEVVSLLEEANIPAGPIMTMENMLADEQVTARNMLVELNHQLGGKVMSTGPLFKMTATPGEISSPAPLLGEHTEQILFKLTDYRETSRKIGDKKVTARALQGVRVLEVGAYTAGPLCTRLLASLGAEVIKIEPPVTGDHVRDFGCKVGGTSYLFHINNYNKKSVTLDTNKKEGKDIFLELVKRSDILVENFVPGTLDRWGLGYSTLQEINPSLIYCSVNGFGWGGSMGKKRAFDTVVQARAGILNQTGYPDGPPTKVGASFADVSAAAFGALAVLAALYHRKVTGEGQFVDVAMYDVMVWMTAELWPFHFRGEKIPERMGNRHYRYVPYNIYRARDGLVVIAAEKDKQWSDLSEVMGCSALAGSARYRSTESRVKHREEVDALVADWAKKLEVAEVVGKCQKAGVPAGQVMELSDIASHPHVLSRQMMVEAPLDSGTMKLLGCPMKLSATPTDFHRPAALLGGHNQEIYCGMLGYSAAQLDLWKSAGLV